MSSQLRSIKRRQEVKSKKQYLKQFKNKHNPHKKEDENKEDSTNK